MDRKLHELERNRDRYQLFDDRAQAGEILAGMLSGHGLGPRTMVLAIPSGGVPVGLEISRRLSLGFDMIIVRKLQIPGNTEAGFGAMGLGGRVHLNDALVSRLGLGQPEVEEQTRVVREELEARNALFRGGRSQPDLSGRTAVLCDDGLASGYTMIAAIDAVRTLGAEPIVVAVPTAPLSSIRLVTPLVDELFCANVMSRTPFAVANAYIHWHDLKRDEVLAMLPQEGA